jgi:hypothetical protein
LSVYSKVKAAFNPKEEPRAKASTAGETASQTEAGGAKSKLCLPDKTHLTPFLFYPIEPCPLCGLAGFLLLVPFGVNSLSLPLD